VLKHGKLAVINLALLWPYELRKNSDESSVPYVKSTLRLKAVEYPEGFPVDSRTPSGFTKINGF